MNCKVAFSTHDLKTTARITYDQRALLKNGAEKLHILAQTTFSDNRKCPFYKGPLCGQHNNGIRCRLPLRTRLLTYLTF